MCTQFSRLIMSVDSETNMDNVVDGLDECSNDHLNIAEPFRFNFEVAWEVAHKGTLLILCLVAIASSYQWQAYQFALVLSISCLIKRVVFSLSLSLSLSLSPVGGIHTVLRSKAGVTTNELGDHYCMIGPYHEPTVRLEVETSEPDLSVTREVIESMKNEGINVINLCMQTKC